MKNMQCDVLVIGHGTAGANAFREARTYTDNVLSIEGNVYGTTCARVGCMPSKLLISAADSAFEAHHAKVFGVHADVKVNGKEVMKRVRDMRDWFVGFVVESVAKIPTEKRIRGMAKFIDSNTVQVDDHTTITAKSIVIATGSTPIVPGNLKPIQKHVQTSDDIFYWDDLPKSIAVFGTGVIALELGQALSRLGVRTTIFGRSGRVGNLTGPTMQEVTNSTFSEELDLVAAPKKMEIQEIENSTDENANVQISFEDADGNKRTEMYETVLSAAGRSPNTDKINIEATGIELNKRGVPVFDAETLQCGESNIFIAGDAMAQHALLHEASDEGKIAGKNAANFPQVEPFHRRVNTSVVFTFPQIAIAGKMYSELDPETIVVGEVDMTRQGRAQVMGQNKGRIQIYAEKSTGNLLGAELLSPRAEHFVHLFSWLIAKETTIDEMLEMPFYHPTMEEGLLTAIRDAKRQLDKQ